ncbi:hypothetical protein ACWEPM_38575 [Streptomyces sp. NPDC004244]
MPTERGTPPSPSRCAGRPTTGSTARLGSTNDGPVDGWIKGGTRERAREHFTSVRDKDHNNARYYTRYRCVNTRDGDVKRAQSWYGAVKNRGYNATTNNCLHMSMAVFKGYSETLRKDARLESASGNTPNQYYTEVLPAARWEASHQLYGRAWVSPPVVRPTCAGGPGRSRSRVSSHWALAPDPEDDQQAGGNRPLRSHPCTHRGR